MFWLVLFLLFRSPGTAHSFSCNFHYVDSRSGQLVQKLSVRLQEPGDEKLVTDENGYTYFCGYLRNRSLSCWIVHELRVRVISAYMEGLLPLTATSAAAITDAPDGIFLICRDSEFEISAALRELQSSLNNERSL